MTLCNVCLRSLCHRISNLTDFEVCEWWYIRCGRWWYGPLMHMFFTVFCNKKEVTFDSELSIQILSILIRVLNITYRKGSDFFKSILFIFLTFSDQIWFATMVKTRKKKWKRLFFQSERFNWNVILYTYCIKFCIRIAWTASFWWSWQYFS